jgi:hypothetical protein
VTTQFDNYNAFYVPTYVRSSDQNYIGCYGTATTAPSPTLVSLTFYSVAGISLNPGVYMLDGSVVIQGDGTNKCSVYAAISATNTGWDNAGYVNSSIGSDYTPPVPGTNSNVGVHCNRLVKLTSTRYYYLVISVGHIGTSTNWHYNQSKTVLSYVMLA